MCDYCPLVQGDNYNPAINCLSILILACQKLQRTDLSIFNPVWLTLWALIALLCCWMTNKGTATTNHPFPYGGAEEQMRNSSVTNS